MGNLDQHANSQNRESEQYGDNELPCQSSALSDCSCYCSILALLTKGPISSIQDPIQAYLCNMLGKICYKGMHLVIFSWNESYNILSSRLMSGQKEVLRS